MAVLHIYVDLAAAGQDPAERYPGVAAHFGHAGRAPRISPAS
jgi:hypothetical protein